MNRSWRRTGRQAPAPGRRWALGSASIWMSGLILAIVIAFTIGGAALAPHDPLAQNVGNAMAGPSGSHWLGTDYLGRDTLSRIIVGTRETIVSAVAMVALGGLLGVLPGIASALLGRRSEFPVLRLVDAWLTLPTIIFAVAVGGLFSNGPAGIVLAIGFLFAPRFFRIVRAESLGIARAQYVEAAVLLGATKWWVIRRHIGRKVLPTIAVTTSIYLGGAVFASSSLNFLGLGSRPPAPTWGGMLSVATNHLWEDTLAPVWPGLIIVMTIWSFHSLADGLRAGTGTTSDTAGIAVAADRGTTGVAETRDTDKGHKVHEGDAGHEDGGDDADRGSAARSGEPRAPVVPLPRVQGTPAPLLTVTNLQVQARSPGPGWPPTPLVHGVGFTLGRGETLGLVGESGSGKTLTCRAVLGALPAGCTVASGSIVFDGQPVTALDERQWRSLRGRRIGTVFQDPASYLNPSISVGRQLAEVLRVCGGLDRRTARTRAVELLDAVEIRDPERVARQIPSHLSGGMQQRVGLAAAVACEPDLLVADEPTTALDARTQSEVLALLADLRARRGMSLLFVSHDLAVVAAVCDRVAVFQHGRIVEHGPTEQILRRPAHPYTRTLVMASPATLPASAVGRTPPAAQEAPVVAI